MAEWLSAASRCASDQSSFHDTPDGLETLQGGRCCKLLRHFAFYALLCTSIQTVISKVPLKQFLLRVQHKVTKHHSEWGKSAKGHRFQLFVTKIHYTFKHWSHVCDSTLWKMCEFILSSKSAVHSKFHNKKAPDRRPELVCLCWYIKHYLRVQTVGNRRVQLQQGKGTWGKVKTAHSAWKLSAI